MMPTGPSEASTSDEPSREPDQPHLPQVRTPILTDAASNASASPVALGAESSPPVSTAEGRPNPQPVTDDSIDMHVTAPLDSGTGVAAGDAAAKTAWLPQQEAYSNQDPSIGEPASTSWWVRTAAYRGVVLGVIAALLGGTGEILLFQEKTLDIGLGFMIAAMLLVAIAWSGVRERPLLLPPSNPGKIVFWRAGLGLRLVCVFGSLVLWAASMWAYFARPDEIFGLQGQLWIAAMVLFIAACVRWRSSTHNETDPGPQWTRLEVVILVSIVVVSFLMRLAWLEEIPWQIHGDVYTSWREAMNFVHDPPLISAFTTTYLGLGQPSLWFVFPAQFMKIFGTGLLGTRLGIAVCGALLVLPVYGIARLSWGRTAAASAAFALAVSASMIHMSRITMPDMSTALWWAGAFYFLLRGLRTRRPSDFMWAGLISGTSQYTHYGSRMLPFVLGAFFVYLAVFHFRAFRDRIAHLALVAAGFLIGSGPISGYFVLHPEMWGSRAGKGFLIPLAIPGSWDGWVHDWTVIIEQLRQNFLMFSVIPARDYFYYASMLLPWEGVLLVLGVGCLLWRWKQPASFMILLWGGSLLLLNSILEVPENPNPNLTHFRPAWAAFYLALAVPPALWLGSLRRVSRRAWMVGAALMGVGAVWLLASNVYFYVVTYPSMVPAENSMRTIQGRLYTETKSNDVVRVVGGAPYGYDREYARMLAPQTAAGEWFNQSRQLPLVGGTSDNQIFVYLPNDPYKSILKYFYPHGQTVFLPGSDGRAAVETYRMSSEELQTPYGVSATLIQTGKQKNPIWQGQVPAVGALPPNIEVTYPLRATWNGSVYVSSAGRVQVQLIGSPDAEVWLPGQTEPNGPTSADVGWLPFVIQTELQGPAQLQMLIKTGDGPPTPVDKLHLWPQSPEQGLAVTVGGSLYPHRIDRFVGSSLMWPVSDPWDIFQTGSLAYNETTEMFNGAGLLGSQPLDHASARWEGELFAEGGDYAMVVHTGEDWQVRLTLDGTSVFSQCGVPGGDHIGQVHLSQGWHHVQLDVMGGTSNTGVQWLWTRPGGVPEIVPPSRLRYVPSVSLNTAIVWPSLPEAMVCPR